MRPFRPLSALSGAGSGPHTVRVVDGPVMAVGVLGPVVLHGDRDAPIPVGGDRQRRLHPEQALSRFGPLLDTWHGMGAWMQLWIAVRSLAEALSRRGRHADATILLGALRASPRASVEYGADSARVRAVEEAARAALGPRFGRLQAQGAALGDSGAIALARRLARGSAATAGSAASAGSAATAGSDGPGAARVR
jgi:hypothetical protein